jgi:predicted nucleotidyltransferase
MRSSLWDHAMNRSDVLRLLSENAAEMRERFQTEKLALFGSAARDELRDDSDVDVLVQFQDGSTADRYFGLKDYLEALLQRRVDLVTESGLKPRARSHVERDLIRVA